MITALFCLWAFSTVGTLKYCRDLAKQFDTEIKLLQSDIDLCRKEIEALKKDAAGHY